MHVCFYITSHGFGHAARCQAVVERLLDVQGWTIELRTSAPSWFFGQVLGPRCSLTAAELDPGVIQSDSFTHDPTRTARAWEVLLAGAETTIEAEAAHLRETGCSLVLADIVPLACAAARRADLPCLVLGNFTWDWILSAYLEAEPRLGAVIEQIQRLYRQADRYLRLPLSPDTGLFAHQEPVGFIARRARRPPHEVRQRLGLGPDEIMVLLSFGGFGVDQLDLQRVREVPGLCCVWDRGPGRPPDLVSAQGLELTYQELIRAADVVLTKPGFSIISEAIAHNTPLAYAPRDGFCESPLLEAFLRERWPSVAVARSALADGSWVEPVVALARGAPRRADGSRPLLPVDGAQQVADRIQALAAGRASRR